MIGRLLIPTYLLTYGISADSLYIRSVKRLKKLQENQFELLLGDFEDEIIDYSPKKYPLTTNLTDRLREIKNEYKNTHGQYTKVATADLNSFCLKLIAATDKHMLFSSDSLKNVTN